MQPSPVPDRIPASQASFLEDVRRVLQVWRRTPQLPLVVLLVAAVQLLSGAGQPAVAGLAGLLSLLLVGWPGAERLWYLRLWTGRSLTPGEAVRATLRCFGRFAVLALVVVPVVLLLALPVLVELARVGDLADDGTLSLTGDLPLWAVAYAAALAVLTYAVLTFVTPALVYSSRRLRDALPIGLRLLRVSWPRTAAYVLVPAVLAGAPGVFLGLEPLGVRTALVTLFTTVVLALSRGAVAAFYLRTVPGAGPDGDVRLGDAAAPSTW